MASVQMLSLLLILGLGSVQSSPPAYSLLQTLLRDYDTAIRPVQNITDAVNFTMDFSLNQVVHLREREQDIKLSIWLRWYWTDHNLKWNSSEHGGIEEFFIQPDRIWLPDITLFNSVSAIDSGWPTHYNAKVNKDGAVTFLFPAFVQASCKINAKHFPFDTQRCVLNFGSWGYSGSAVDIYPVNQRANIASFVSNGVWDLIDVPVTRVENFFACCPDDPFPELKYTIILNRMPRYYIFNLLMPCVIITVLNLLTFLIPVESGEKVALNITVLLSMMVFLLIVAEIMPPQSEVLPAIGLYFGACICLLTVATLATVFVLHLHFRGGRGRPVPPLLKRALFNWLGKLLLYGATLRNSDFMGGQKIKSTRENGSVKSQELERSQNYLPDIPNQPSAHERAEEEWRTVALIMDRLFFVLFTVGTIAVTCFIFMQT